MNLASNISRIEELPIKRPAFSPEFNSKLDEGIGMIRTKYPRLYFAIRHHRTTHGHELNFMDREWLRDIYKDNSSNIVILKPSQIGISELFICDIFSLAKQGLRGMYVLDSDTRRATFVADRIDKLADYSPEYAAAIKKSGREADSRVLKTIYGQSVKFVGSKARAISGFGSGEKKKPSAFFEYSCDVYWVDEYDLHDPDMLTYADDRIQASKNPMTRKFGNPTEDGRGIHAEFLKSDQKYYVIPCDKCHADHILDWETHFVEKTPSGSFLLRDPENGNPVCTECGNTFNRLARGKWTADNPDSGISGYAISRLYTHLDSNDIFKLFDTFIAALGNQSKMQNFYNNRLGVTYENRDDKLTEAILARCAAFAITNKKPLLAATPEKDNAAAVDPPAIRTVAGMDQGAEFTIKISEVWDNVLWQRYVGNVRTIAEAEAIFVAHNVTCGVIDAQGGGYAETRDFVARHSGWWMCYYVPKDRVKQLYDMDYEHQVVNTNRTEICDVMVKCYRDGARALPATYKSDLNGKFVDQMTMPSRVTDAGGRPIWTKGVDHCFHASVYETLAWLISGMKNSIREKQSWRV